MEKEKLRLKIDAHVVQQLGAELITSPAIALLELIKNSHDADAKYCEIDVDTTYNESIDGVKYEGRITIKDNGHGMTRDVINRSWLTVSYSQKREDKLKKSVDPKNNTYNRVYTGDKGLGRLGTMQLAPICRISTHHTANESGTQVSFSWDKCQHGTELNDVPVTESELQAKKSRGTIIECIGLHNLDYWNDENAQKLLVQQISSMVSPHGQIDNFKVLIKSTGIDTETTEIADNILKQSASKFKFKVDETSIRVSGDLDLLTYKPQIKKDNPEILKKYENYILADDGKLLVDYLSNQKKLKEYKISHNEGKYKISFELNFDISDIENTKTNIYTHPGKFKGAIYNFILNNQALDLKLADMSSYDKLKEIIKDVAGGISAYRDGFRIGSGKVDWLNLSSEMTSGGGAYSLRPGNTTGFIDLSWKDNSKLVEKSDRESFVENNDYLTFYIFCQFIIKSINNFLNVSRRASLDFSREMSQEDANKPKGYSAKLAAKEIETISIKGIKAQKNIEKEMKVSKKEFKERRAEVEQVIDRCKDDLFNDPRITKELDSIKDLINKLESQVTKNLSEYHDFSKDLANHIESADQILVEIDNYENQIKNFYDHVAIGLSAQYLSHEANSQITNIRLHTNSATSRVKELGIKDVTLTKELNSVKTDTQVLSKSISSLSPLVRAQREVIENIRINEFIQDYFKVRLKYFKNKNIEIKIENQNDNVQCIRFNPGKLFQVIDNIIRNSEHWLEVFQIHYPKEHFFIKVLIDNHKIIISDSARGVREPIENVLFDMFASDKENGQGLGLFIVKTLLDERGCSAKLLNDRNKFGRKFRFEIDLTEAAE